MNDNFLCKCGHRNKIHATLEEAAEYNNHKGRMCLEYEDAICVKGIWYHGKEWICHCDDFVPDNLKYLEQQSEMV